MPKPKPVKMKPDKEDPATWESESLEVDPEDQELDNVFADFPQNDACIELFRVPKLGGRPLFLEQMTPAQFSFAYVTEKFGGGQYFARAKYRDGQKIRMPFEIEGDPIIVRRTAPVSPGVSQVVMPSAAEPIVIQEGDDKQTLASIMQMMLRQMQQSEVQMLEKMKLYKELFGSSQQAPLDTALNMFQKGVEMAALGGADGGSPWIMLARELKEPLSKIVDTVQLAMTKGGPPPPPAHGMQVPLPPLGPGEGTKTAAVGPREAAQEDSTVLTMVKMMMPTLVTAASHNADPGTYVELILDQVPQTYYTQVKNWLEKPGCLDQLAAIEPGIRFQQQWWSALRQGLLDALHEELTDADARAVHDAEDRDPSAVDPTSRPPVA